jgi:flavin reductase (DIM6/NTAB) family NADH-FMN oxidoreductase RutF
VIVSQSFDYDSFRRSCAAFATGITVTTVTGADGSPQGLTANSFTSVSWDPPLVLICLDKRASVYCHFINAAAYTIHVLAEDQKELSIRFSSPANDRFAGLNWRAGSLGAPLIEGCLATLECAIERVVDAGDHTLFLGAVQCTDCRPGKPLLYFDSCYSRLVG